MNLPTPTVLGLKKSFGFGDPLGLATPGHVAAVAKTDFAPIFAQQSVREMERTQRTLDSLHRYPDLHPEFLVKHFDRHLSGLNKGRTRHSCSNRNGRSSILRIPESPVLRGAKIDGSRGIYPTVEAPGADRRRGATHESWPIFQSSLRDSGHARLLPPWTQVHGYHQAVAPRLFKK